MYTHREAREGGFLHLVRGFLTNGEDGDFVAKGEELFNEPKPDYSMTATVGVYD